MIIFDLDGTLADCDHRRHFVKRTFCIGDSYGECTCGKCWNWKPDWKAFYEACDQDNPIESVISIWNDQISLGGMQMHQIWSGRCESVRQKTEKWLNNNLLCFESHQLRMRPIGDNTPDDQLKERWLDEYLNMPGIGKYRGQSNKVDFVFDDRPKVIRMWRRRGIFVFNCCQHEKEF